MTESPESSPSGSYQFRFGIRSKILIALTLFNIAITAAFTTSQHHTEKSRILGGIENKLRAAATALPRMLPPGYLDQAVTRDAISPETYRAIVDSLNQYCAENNLIYLYTYYYHENGVFYCTSTNGTPDEMASGDYTPYFDPYLEAPDSIYEAVRTMQPVNEIVTDRWGTVFTLFYPMQTEAGTTFVAGADVDIAFVDTLLANSLHRSLILGVSAFIILFLISFYASTRFSRAIQRLATYTGEFTSANFSTPAQTSLRQEILALPQRSRDEIGRLANAFLVMEDQLEIYLRDLTETTAAKERIENELKLAGKIQTGMLPRAFDPGSHQDRVALHAAMKPARETGGDLYDYFFIDQDHLCFCIGDVSGKGMPAALFMTVAVTVLRANATAAFLTQPEEILSRANNLLNQNNESCTFVTLFLGILNVRTGELTYTDGGHNRPYLRSPGEPAKPLSIEGGTALGVMEDLPFSSQTRQLKPGDTLFLYTDGVNEAVSSDDQFYSDERLANLLSSLPEEVPVSDWIEQVMDDVARFAKGAEQSDDITVLALRIPSP